MIKNKILILLFAGALLTVTQSCKKGFFEGVNDNPNEPTEVIPRVLLPGAQANLGYHQNGDVGRYVGLMTQYITGFSRQFATFNSYSFTEEDFNNLWNNMYAATMMNFKQIMNIAEETPGGYDAYDGVARIMMAYSIGMSTDLWGDIPYNEAFLGNDNLTPAYNTQEEIYGTIQTLLDEGISILSSGNEADDFEVPGVDDYVYDGDLGAWIAFANALKARYYIHLTEIDAAGNAQNALDALNAGGPITTAAVPFSLASNNPWYQYIEQRDDIIYEGYCITLMTDRNDPRLGVYIDLDGTQTWGINYEVPGYLGDVFAAADASVFLMTEFERKFIEAEAKFRLGDAGGAQTAFADAIQESFTFYGVDDSSAGVYIAAFGTLNAGTELEQIITEKYIANFLHPESWVDYRRTGLPVLTPNTGSEIPRRFIYPTNERLYNSSIPTATSTMFTPRLWWDVN